MGKQSQPALESTIQKAIMDKLREEFPGLMIRKRHGTRMGVAGDPDLTGCYRGLHFEMEVKREGEQPTKLQQVRLDQWGRAGAIVGVVRSISDARQLLRAGLRHHFRTERDIFEQCMPHSVAASAQLGSADRQAGDLGDDGETTW